MFSTSNFCISGMIDLGVLSTGIMEPAYMLENGNEAFNKRKMSSLIPKAKSNSLSHTKRHRYSC